jgi:hypothetical protein
VLARTTARSIKEFVGSGKPSRSPFDLPAFCPAIVEPFAHAGQPAPH